MRLSTRRRQLAAAWVLFQCVRSEGPENLCRSGAVARPWRLTPVLLTLFALVQTLTSGSLLDWKKLYAKL